MNDDEKTVPELIVDPSHKKISIGRIKGASTRISAVVMGLFMVFSINSGFPRKVKADSSPPPGIHSTEISDDTVVELPLDIHNNVCWEVRKNYNEPVTVGDLKKVKDLQIPLTSETSSLDFLNYCINLVDLTFYAADISSFDILLKIPNLPNNLEKLYIDTYGEDFLEITPEIMSHLIKTTRTPFIRVGASVVVDPGCEDYISMLDTFGITIYDYSSDIDFKKIVGLKELDFRYTPPYTLAMFLNREDYNYLVNNGTNIVFRSDEIRDEYFRALDELDRIVDSLNIDENSSDIDVINAILVFVLDNLTYSPEIKNNQGDASKFYDGGYLSAIFNRPDQICGNYAALVEALMDRVRPQEDSVFLISENHAWNEIIIDGELYYVDATWLENDSIVIEERVDTSSGYSITYRPVGFSEAVSSGLELDQFDWYMHSTDPDEVRLIDQYDAHIPKFTFSYMQPRPWEKVQEPIATEIPAVTDEPVITEKPLITDNDEKEEKTYRLTIDGKVYIIGGAALVSILSALGVIVSVKKKKEAERRRKMKEAEWGSYDSFGGYHY